MATFVAKNSGGVRKKLMIIVSIRKELMLFVIFVAFAYHDWP